jgi:hypothetical protein
MKMIQIIGKRNRPVPILLTTEMLTCMDLLCEKRKSCGVVDNTFFFAIPGTSTHLHFFPVLQKIAKAARMKRPDLLTTTRLRKHVATMAQVITRVYFSPVRVSDSLKWRSYQSVWHEMACNSYVYCIESHDCHECEL